MKAELLKLNTEQYGLQENKAKELESLYKPMLLALSVMEAEFNELVIKKITPEVEKDAKDLRIRISKVRIAGEKAKTAGKAEFIRAGNAIQGAYNTLKYAVESKEDKLKDIENYSINIAKERLAKLEAKRLVKLQKFEPLTISDGRLGGMDADVWENYINGVQLNHEQRIAAEKKAEDDRIAAEKAEKDRIAKIEAENKKLEKEKIEAEKERKRLAKIQVKKDQERKAKEDAAEKERERIAKIEADKREKERKELEIIENKKRAVIEKKLQEEKTERQKIADEWKAEKVKELKEKQAKEATEKTARLAPDKDKLLKLANDLFLFPIPDLKSNEAEIILKDVRILLGKIKKHIEEKVKTL